MCFNVKFHGNWNPGLLNPEIKLGKALSFPETGFGISHTCLLAVHLSFQRNTLKMLIKSTILVFFWCVTNYHKFHGFKQHPFISSQFCRLKDLTRLSLILYSLHHKAEINILARLSSFLETGGKIHFQAQSGCWQKVPCGCGPVSVLLLSVEDAFPPTRPSPSSH